jgi:hypothetical protein
MKTKAGRTANWHDVLDRHRFRVTLSCGVDSRVLIVTSVAVAKTGLEPGWRVSQVDQWDPARCCWFSLEVF